MKSLASLLIAAALAVTAHTSFAADAPAAHAPAAPAAPAAPKADPKLGSDKFAATCAACHGADGNSAVPANPKLAQQHPAYLVKQLQEFKSGKRASPVMQGFASQLSEADMFLSGLHSYGTL